jgi:Tfp pilus assembly protein PilF
MHNFEDTFLKSWRPYAWIIFLCLAVYGQALFFDFSHYDDDTLIIQNQPFLKDISNIPQAFAQQVFPQSRHAPYYRPMLTISFMLDAQLGPMNPTIYHSTNVALHIASCCLLFLLLILLKHRKDLSLFFSLLFAVHPILLEAVAWIPGRNDSLLTVFALLAFICAIRFIDGRQWKFYIGYILSFALAIFSKEAAILLIGMIGIYLVFIRKEKVTSFNMKALGIGWAIIVIIWFLMRDIALSQCPVRLTIPDMIVSVIRNLPQILIYLGKIILPLPFNLSAFPTPENSPLTYGFIVIAILAIAFIMTRSKRYGFILLGVIWFTLFLLPSLVSPNIEKLTIFALEHRIYLPLVGFIIFILETDIIKNIDIKKQSTLAVMGLIIAVFFIVSFLRVPIYKNRITLWEKVTEESPHVAMARQNLAGIYYVEGMEAEKARNIPLAQQMLDKSEFQYKKTLELNPGAQQAHYFLGLIYTKKNMPGAAIEEFNKELLIKPEDDQIFFNLGIAYYMQSKVKVIEANQAAKNLEEAKTAWLKALNINPRLQTIHNNIGLVYMDQQKYAQAEEEFRKELALNGNYETAYFNLGMLYIRTGKLRQAEEMWQRTIQINPNHLDAYSQLAMYYFEQKNYTQSKLYVEQLMRRGVQPPPDFLKSLEDKLRTK